MGVILTRDTTVLVQGITGREGSFWTQAMLEAGTNIVAGVTPGKAGQMVCDLPVYDTVQQALNTHRIEASVIYVPPAYAKDAAIEALASGIKKIVLLVDGLPVMDALEVRAFAREKQAMVIGPNTPGVVTVGEAMMGFIPFWLERVYQPGTVGFLSRSGSLANEVSSNIVASGFGLSTFVGVGGDPAPCTRMVDIIKLFETDPDTEAIILVGEIGGTMEEETAEYCLNHGINKPLIAYIAGSSAPPGKKMGHAGAIIHGEKGSVKHKESKLLQAGAQIATSPAEIGILLKQCLNRS